MPSTADTHGEMSPATLPGAFPEGHCLAKFHALVGFVERTDGEFPSAAERERPNAVLDGMEPARRPDVRLPGRRGSIFRAEGLEYAEIADLAAAEFGARGPADVAPSDALGEPLSAFTGPGRLARPELGSVRGPLRVALPERIRDTATEPVEPARPRVSLVAGEHAVRPNGHVHHLLFSSSFLGNLRSLECEWRHRHLERRDACGVDDVCRTTGADDS